MYLCCAHLARIQQDALYHSWLYMLLSRRRFIHQLQLDVAMTLVPCPAYEAA